MACPIWPAPMTTTTSLMRVLRQIVFHSLRFLVEWHVREIADGPAMPLEVEVHAPVTKHTNTLPQVQRWLEGSVNSPNEMVKRRS